MTERILPHDLEAEKGCIGAVLLLGAPALEQLSGILHPEDCYAPANQEILAAAEALSSRGQPIDRKMVESELRARDKLSRVGGFEYLAEVMRGVTTAESVPFFAKLVREKAQLRQLIRVCQEVGSAAYSPTGTADEELTAAISALSGCYSSDTGEKSIAEVITKIHARCEKRTAMISEGREDELDPLGVPTGIRALDSALTFDGLPRGTQPTVLGADTSTGKTAFATGILTNTAHAHAGSALYCTLEDRGESMVTRMISSLSRLPNKMLQSQRVPPAEWQKFSAACGELWNKKIWFMEGVPKRARDLCSRIKRHVKKHGCDLVVVDYLQLFREEGRNKQEKVDEAYSECVDLALSLPNTATIIVSQLHRRDKAQRPSTDDFYHSGSIEQGCGTALLLWDPPIKEPLPAKVCVVGKQKNGPRGIAVILGWNEETSSFDNAPDYITTSMREQLKKVKAA